MSEKKKFFQPITSLLDDFLSRLGISYRVHQAQVISSWKEVISELMGNTIAKNTKALSFHKDELLVAVSNPIFAQEILNKSSLLLKQINARNDKIYLEKIRTIVRNINEN